DNEDLALGNDMAEAAIFKGVYNPTRFSETPLDLLKMRNLKVYYSRRQYPGSPPVIPHRIADDMYGKKNSCPECHRDGGYSPTQEAFAPVTPHPEFENCVQCHVPKRTNRVFRKNHWKSVDPPKIRRSALPGSPPPIPHSTQLRENCSACHTGPASVFEIHTPHPERINCVQCHVPQNGKGVFTRQGY
ncbi:MAG: cytochrome C, partial [Nitrospinota bacterium]